MKTLFILLPLVACGALAAEPERKDQSLRTDSTSHSADRTLTARAVKPNEIVHRRVTYSGVAVQVVKTKNPLQLINPFAPMEYGSGYANTARDVTTGAMTGVSVFAVKF